MNIHSRSSLIKAIFSIVLILSFFILFEPFLEKNTSLNREIKAVNLRIRKCKAILKNKDKILSKASNLSGYDAFELLERPTSADLLSEFENLAKDAGLRIVSIRPQVYKEGDKLQGSLIELQAEGRLENFQQFISQINASSLFFEIKKFHLESTRNPQVLNGLMILSQANVE